MPWLEKSTMNGPYPSRDGNKESDEQSDLCDRLRVFGLNERPRLSLECRERATASLQPVSDLEPVGFANDRNNVGDPLQKQPCTFPQPNAPPAKPGARFYTTHDALTDKVAGFRKPEPECTRIEVAPGITARLRGAKETMKCVENDFYLPTTCFCCSQDLFCIMDASFVLCPKCRVISPMEGSADGLEGGVGIGFTYDDLREFQTEILLRQQRGPRKFY